MSRIQVIRRCFNCGTPLQTDDPEASGYINKETFEKYGPSSVLLCDKCFHEARYNIAPRAPEIDDDFLSIVQDAKASDSLIVYFVDVFSFEASFAPELVDELEGAKVLVCANKRDLLPPKESDDALREYVAHRFRAAKVAAKADDVILTSLNSLSNVSALVEEIQRRREFHDVYLLGSKNAGKSAFRDAFLRTYNNSFDRPVETVLYPRTEIPVMQIPLDASTYLYDFPGFPITNDIRGVCEGLVRKITPLKHVNGRKLALPKGGAFSLEGLLYVALTSGKKTNMNLYFKNELAVRHGSSKALEGSFFRRLKDGKVGVYDPSYDEPADFDAFDIEVTETGKRDIGIEGLGWFSFEADKQTFRIMVPKGVSVYTSRTKIKRK